jgi:hypothetical protein
MSKRRRFYILEDDVPGTRWKKGDKAQILEATYQMDVPIYKSDLKKAIWSDPRHCIIAIGMKRLPRVIEAFVGQGKDAYLILEIGGKLVAWHFVIGASARKVLDAFDIKGSAKTQHVTLRVPTKALKLAYRRKSNARRQAEIRAKTGKPVVSRGPRKAARMERLVHNTTQREKPPVVSQQTA